MVKAALRLAGKGVKVLESYYVKTLLAMRWMGAVVMPQSLLTRVLTGLVSAGEMSGAAVVVVTSVVTRLLSTISLFRSCEEGSESGRC